MIGGMEKVIPCFVMDADSPGKVKKTPAVVQNTEIFITVQVRGCGHRLGNVGTTPGLSSTSGQNRNGRI